MTTLTLSDLTPRQQDVLRLLAESQSTREIALALGIVEHTVRLHLMEVYRKLNACNRVQAARWAWERGAGGE